MTSATPVEPLRTALSHFQFAMAISRRRRFERDDDNDGRRDRYAIEGALYLGASALASASGWLLRHPPEVRNLAYSVVDLGPLQVGDEDLPAPASLLYRIQAARVVAAYIELEGREDA